MTDKPRMVVGISGATGVIYGIKLLHVLKTAGIETHLIMSRTAEITLAYESSLKVTDVQDVATVHYRIDDLAAAVSSGSFRTMGMIVAPCSARCLAEIATCAGNNLLTRAADVTLKERRRLVLMLRETPLHLGHIRNMAAVTEMGGIIAPPSPAFYTRPQSLEDMVEQGVGRVLDLFDLDIATIPRWGKDVGPEPRPTMPQTTP